MMSILGFFKKKGAEKKGAMQGLEIPQPPPIKEPADIYAELPSFPGIDNKEKSVLPPLEPLSSREPSQILSMEAFPQLTHEKKEDVKLPESKAETPRPIVQEKLFEKRWEFPEISMDKKKPEPAFRFPHEKESLTEHPFVKAHKFRSVLESISQIANTYRETSRIVSELHRIESEKEQKEEQWHSAIEAMQRKLVFAERTLFE